MSNSVRLHRWQPTRLPCPWDSPGKNTGVDCHFLLQCMKVKSESEVAQSCPTLRDPMDCSPPGSPVHEIFQATVLEWGAIAFSAPLCISHNKYRDRDQRPGELCLHLGSSELTLYELKSLRVFLVWLRRKNIFLIFSFVGYISVCISPL